jgi:hypothetical protein
MMENIHLIHHDAPKTHVTRIVPRNADSFVTGSTEVD